MTDPAPMARPPAPTTEQQREALILLARVLRGEGLGMIRRSGSRAEFVVVAERDKTTV